MLCTNENCQSPLLPVYKDNDGWRWYCPRCNSYSFPDNSKQIPDLEEQSGKDALSAAQLYLDRNFAEAEKNFSVLSEKSKDPDWEIACYWYSLLCKYGVVYTDNTQLGSIVNLWRFPLPTDNPDTTSEWRNILTLKPMTREHDTILDMLNFLQAEINYKNRNRTPYRVFIAWNHWENENRNSQTIASALYRVLNNIDGFNIHSFEIGNSVRNMRNYGAKIHYAMKTADLMVIILDNNGLKEHTPFYNEFTSFFGMRLNYDSVLLCNVSGKGINDVLPEKMVNAHWEIKWNINFTDREENGIAYDREVNRKANQMAIDINNHLRIHFDNTKSTDSQQVPKKTGKTIETNLNNEPENISSREDIQKIQEYDQRFKSLKTDLIDFFKCGYNADPNWISQTEDLWKESKQDRFGKILLCNYCQKPKPNNKAALNCFETLVKSGASFKGLEKIVDYIEKVASSEGSLKIADHCKRIKEETQPE